MSISQFDPVVAAKAAGLRYVTDTMPGIRRIGTGKAFRYLDTNGRMIRNAATLQRIRTLAIPPAWRDVWICVIAEGHLQAVGRDARGRKQYRYHARWRETRDETKYHRMAAFGSALPRIRRQVTLDLKASQLSLAKVVATIVRLLEITLIRVGNREYASQNNSFGLTTFRDHHVNIAGPHVQFYFRGKSGVKHTVRIEDPYLAKIVRRLRDLPGYELFQYINGGGERRTVGSADVNQYIRDAAGDDFTAKDFRTWTGTILAAMALCDCEFTNQRHAQRNIKEAIAAVAKRLGNTPTICRKCYIHPAVIESYLNGSLAGRLKPARGGGARKSAWLNAEETAVLKFLQDQSRRARRA